MKRTKSKTRKQRMHTGRVQRKADKKRKVQKHEAAHGGVTKRSSGRGLAPFQIPTPMLAAFAGMQQFLAMQELVAAKRKQQPAITHRGRAHAMVGAPS